MMYIMDVWRRDCDIDNFLGIYMFRLHPLLRSLNLLKSVVRPRALALSMPFLLCGYLYQQNQCFFWGQKYSRNKL